MIPERIASVNNGGGEFGVIFESDFGGIPKGTEGIVVYVHGSGEAYTLEVGPFNEIGVPSNGVMTVPSNKVKEQSKD